jgi:hypothetical protein
MIRVLAAALALAVLPPGSRAEEKVVRLSVQPMPAPKPVLKYLLLPEVREMNPGNPVQWYLRSFQEQRNFFFGKGASAERARYLALPLAKLPADKLRNYGGYALRQADWAARLDTPDWEVLQRLSTEGLGLRLPELKPLPVLAAALRVRFRGAVAGRRFDDAVRTAKTMFALARHLGTCPALAANRLGLSVAGGALDTLEEMLEQPGCPNLYWALTDLPGPLVDLRQGLQGEATRADAGLRGLREDAPMTEAEVEEVVRRLSGALGFAREQAGLPPRSLRAVLQAGVKDPKKLRAARDRLLEAAAARQLSPAQALRFLVLVQQFPPTQVILLDEKRAYEVQRDERVKLLALAPWQIAQTGGAGPVRRGAFADLLPDVLKTRQAQGRLEQRIALLRHVEALRLYAAAHDGKLPLKLSDCSVPLPDDPFTGKPFRYHLDGTTAHLRAEGAHYQVTIKK